jgi:hypothetical protein
MKVLGKCQLREVVQGKEEGLNSSGTLLIFIVIAMVEVPCFASY